MKKTLRNTMASTAVAAIALALVAQPAQAAQITQWSYDLYTHFANPAANVFSSGGGTQIQQLGQVSWGNVADNVFATGAERSGITIASIAGADQSANPLHVTGTYATDTLLTPATGAWITHHNNSISGSYATLLSSVIDSTLVLTSVTPSGVAVTDTIPFTVLFEETENLAGTCVVDSLVPCNDIFALNGDNFNKHLYVDGYDYYVSIFPTAGPGVTSGKLPFLGSSVCGAAGALPNCVGFTTVEGQDTSIQFGFTITSTPIDTQVPEPGILALLGIGLMGLFVARRRQS